MPCYSDTITFSSCISPPLPRPPYLLSYFLFFRNQFSQELLIYSLLVWVKCPSYVFTHNHKHVFLLEKLSIYLVLVRDLGQTGVKVRDLEVYISSICWVLALGIYLYFPLCSPQCPCPVCLTHSSSSEVLVLTYLPLVFRNECASSEHAMRKLILAVC